MKCIQCGKQVTQPKTALCNDCFSAEHTCLKGYKEHTLLVCTMCNKHKYKKHWKPKKESAIKESVLHHCSFLHKPTKTKVHVTLGKPQHNKQKGEATLKTETIIDGHNVKEEFVFPIKITHTLCDNCANTKTSYFEGILQLRGTNKEAIKEAHDYILAETKKKNNEGVFVNKIETLKNGFDFYYTRQRYIPVIAKKLQKKFGATFATAAQLFTRRKGKDLYRVNAVVRLP
jgi:NMD protein affecting ribosome stability and mRNA decay